MWYHSRLFAVCGHWINGRIEGSSLVAVTSLFGTVAVSGCLHLTVAKVSRQGAGFPAVTNVFQKIIGLHFAGHGGVFNFIPCVLLICAALMKMPTLCERTAESTKYFGIFTKLAF